MWLDPYTEYAIERGCDSCGTSVPSCYAVQFYILPSKLVRKRHRERSQTVIFCRSCYEAVAELPILLNGNRVGLPLTGLHRRECPPCLLCRQSISGTSELYGVVASGLWMSGSCIESYPLAYFCPECVDDANVVLLDKIQMGPESSRV